MGWKIRWRYVFGGLAALLVASVATPWVIEANRPRSRGYDGPATVRPTWVTTEFVDGRSVFELTIAASPTLVRPTPPDQRVWMVDQRIDRLTLKCNGRLLGDYLPDALLVTDFTVVGFDTSRVGQTTCDDELSFIRLERPDVWREGPSPPAFVVGFSWGKPVIFGPGRGPSLPARRIRGRYAIAEEGAGADFVIDATLANGQLQTVSFDCGEGSRPPIRVDSPAPAGAFAMEIAVDSADDGRCGNTRMTLYGSKLDEARSYLFENNARLVKVGAPGFDDLDVEPYKPKRSGFFGLWQAKR